jgi:hypothetical protein
MGTNQAYFLKRKKEISMSVSPHRKWLWYGFDVYNHLGDSDGDETDVSQGQVGKKELSTWVWNWDLELTAWMFCMLCCTVASDMDRKSPNRTGCTSGYSMSTM